MTRRPTPSRSELSKALTRAQKAARDGDAGWQHPELEHVPTVLELAAQGLARPVDGGSAYRIEPAGQQLIYDAMKRNAERLKADPELARRVTLDATIRARKDRA